MIKIKGNGAVKVNGRYIFYREGVPAPIPESVAKRIGKEYEVITANQVHKTVVTQSEKREKIDATDSEESKTIEGEPYPKHTGGPWYELSNGEKVNGKDNAIKAQKELES